MDENILALIISGSILLAGILLFFFLASRKNYRDGTQAQNYEQIRNKLTTREAEPVKAEEEEEDDRDYIAKDIAEESSGLSSIISFSMMIVVFAVIICVGTTVLSSLNSALNETSSSNYQNASTPATEVLETMSPFIGSIFPLIIVLGLIIFRVLFN